MNLLPFPLLPEDITIDQKQQYEFHPNLSGRKSRKVRTKLDRNYFFERSTHNLALSSFQFFPLSLNLFYPKSGFIIFNNDMLVPETLLRLIITIQNFGIFKSSEYSKQYRLTRLDHYFLDIYKKQYIFLLLMQCRYNNQFSIIYYLLAAANSYSDLFRVY